MKTTITIENGKVSVQVDDNQPTQVKTSPPPIILQGSEPEIKRTSIKDRVPEAPKHIQKPIEKPVLDKPAAGDRKCAICGDDISHLDKRSTICKKPDCIKSQKRIYMQRWAEKKRSGTVPPKQEEEQKVDWCKHCQAYTTHDSDHHPKPKVEPQFMPGHEKSAAEIEDWRPKTTGIDDKPVPRGTIQHTPALDGFPDPWDCDACRRRSHLCPLHQGMTDDGKEPPKPKGRPPQKF